MIQAFIVVGNYLTEKEMIDHAIPYDFYQLPSKGDTVALNSQLKAEVDRMRIEWNMAAGTRLNFVRGICWVQGMPFVFLGADPKLVLVDMIYGEYGKSRNTLGVALKAIPRVGDMVQADEFGNDFLYVTDIAYSGNFVFAYLSKSRESQRVFVTNSELDVSVTNNRLDVDIINNYA